MSTTGPDSFDDLNLDQWQTRQVAEGIIVSVKGMPGSRKVGLRGVQAGAMRIGVTQVAEKGKANEAILEVLAQALGIRSNRLTLVSGHTAREKQVLVADWTREQLLAAARKD